MLKDSDKHEIIDFVNENMEGEAVCDDESNNMIVFTFENEPNNQAMLGTEIILDLLKRGFFVIYACVNEDGKFEMAIGDSEEFKS